MKNPLKVFMVLEMRKFLPFFPLQSGEDGKVAIAGAFVGAGIAIPTEILQKDLLEGSIDQTGRSTAESLGLSLNPETGKFEIVYPEKNADPATDKCLVLLALSKSMHRDVIDAPTIRVSGGSPQILFEKREGDNNVALVLMGSGDELEVTELVDYEVFGNNQTMNIDKNQYRIKILDGRPHFFS